MIKEQILAQLLLFLSVSFKTIFWGPITLQVSVHQGTATFHLLKFHMFFSAYNWFLH